MDNEKIFSYVDHTLLKVDASLDEIITLCGEAVKYKTASVCIPPSYVKIIKKKYGGKLTICTVVGFPLGYSKKSAKKAELRRALRDGASEFDMVINVGDAKNNKFKKIESEIKSLKRLAGKKILKVIVETCYLTEEEKIKLCKCVTKAGADFIKTSTGFGPGGATLGDVELFKNHVGGSVKIKAAGGIKTREEMIAYIEAGCGRIGTSSAVKILTGGDADGY